jgi:hypothetical protein
VLVQVQIGHEQIELVHHFLALLPPAQLAWDVKQRGAFLVPRLFWIPDRATRR